MTDKPLATNTDLVDRPLPSEVAETGSFDAMRPFISSFTSSILQAATRLTAGLANGVSSSALDDEARRLPLEAAKSVRALLEKPGLENEQLKADVVHKLAQRETELAHARRIHAEACEIELRVEMDRIVCSCVMLRSIAQAYPDGEAINLCRMLDAITTHLDAIRQRPSNSV